jgi:hypothetical protein
MPSETAWHCPRRLSNLRACHRENLKFHMFLLLCYKMTAGKISRELWWMTQEFSPVNIIIPPWLSIFIYHLGDE